MTLSWSQPRKRAYKTHSPGAEEFWKTINDEETGILVGDPSARIMLYARTNVSFTIAAAYLLVTPTRLMILSGLNYLAVPFRDPLFRQLEFNQDSAERVIVAAPNGAAENDWSNSSLTFSFSTPDAYEIHAYLIALQHEDYLDGLI